MITDLLTKRIQALSQRQTFLGVFSYKMSAKINCHRYGTESRHCHLTARVRLQFNLSADRSKAADGLL